MATDELMPGTIVGGRYRVERLVGRGGMGAVVEATDVARGGTCAVKVLRSRFLDSAAVVERFRREARILDAVEHPGIVRIRDCGEAEQGVFIAMELLRGETLLDRLRREAPLSPAALGPIVEALCDALAAVHAQGVIHRDLKPANVFLPEDGAPAVKLIDFGVAKVLDLARLTLTGQVIGTVSYMAPEQLSSRPVDERVDIYAVGVMLHAALRGRPPFPRETHLAAEAILAGDAPPLEGVTTELAAVVAKAMSVEARSRFASANDLARAFRAAIDQAGAAATRSLERGGSVAGEPSTPPTAIGTASGPAPGPQAASLTAPTDPFSLVRIRARSRSRWLYVSAGLLASLAGLGASVALWPTRDAAESHGEPAARLVPQPPDPETVPEAMPISHRIEIVSTPEGAGIYESGVMLGNTPFTLVMESGDPPRGLELRHAGHDPTAVVVSPEDERVEVMLPARAIEARRREKRRPTKREANRDRIAPSQSPMRGSTLDDVVNPWAL